MEANQTINLRISGGIADYTLDCWPEECGPRPEGKNSKTLWVGAVDARQLREFYDQASQQADLKNSDEYSLGCSEERNDINRWVNAKASIIKQAKDQGVSDWLTRAVTA